MIDPRIRKEFPDGITYWSHLDYSDIGLEFTLRDWINSIIALTYQIKDLCAPAGNLFNESQTERGEYFFSDFGIPLPRTSTAIAWASLCSLEPLQGWERFDDAHNHFNHLPFRLASGNFLLPFLPSLRADDLTNQSLIRTSRLHSKDEAGRIHWGSIYIADAATGVIKEKLETGQIIAKEFWTKPPRTLLRTTYPHDVNYHIPPLWSEYSEGWQFGIFQNLPTQTLTLRDPMIFLSQRGIIGGKTLPGVPKIKRLLLRFLDPSAARQWAKAYSEAVTGWTRAKAQMDFMMLIDDIKKAEQERFKESSSKKKPKAGFDSSSLPDF